jgi:N-acetyl-anhydromuramyl-L-alanine amidase AmpD
MNYSVVNHRLHLNGQPVKFVRANSFGSRMTPELIVLHDTAGSLAAGSSVSWFTNKKCKVSAHLVTERDGTITQLVPFDHRAYHAGVSSWFGRKNCNAFSIGNEIVNPGVLKEVTDGAKAWFGEKFQGGVKAGDGKRHPIATWLPYTYEQIQAVNGATEALARAYPTIDEVTTHWAIAPGRKVDTNPLYPLDQAQKALARAKAPKQDAYGEIKLGSRDANGSQNGPVRLAQSRLRDLGYSMVGTPDGIFGARSKAAALAFESENDLTTDGVLSIKELAILFSDAAKSMPIGERHEATIADLKAAGSKEVIEGGHVKKTGALALAGVAVEAGSETLAGVSPWDSVSQALDHSADVVGKVTGTGLSIQPKYVAMLLAILVGCALWKWGSGIQIRRLIKHRLGVDTNH